MIYDYFIGRFKATLLNHIWIEHLAKRVMFCLFFLGLQTPLTPLSLTEGMVEFCSREVAAFKIISGSAYDIVQQHFFHNILQGKSIIYTNNKLHNYSKCKNCRQVLLQRAGEILTDFSFAFQARARQFIFLSDRFLCYFFKFFLLHQNKLYTQLSMCRCDTDAPAGIAKLKYGTSLVKNCLTPRCISARCILNIAENNSNRTTSKLDLCILVTHYWNFSKSKGHNSAENYSTGPKFTLNLYILKTHLNPEFQFKMSICNGDNERKLKINGIF